MAPSFNPQEFDPKDQFTPPPNGEYGFLVVNAEESDSKAGNPMLNLTLEVEVGREKPMTIYDRLVFVPKALWRIHQFCAATGFDFESGQMDASDVTGLGGKAKFILGEARKEGKNIGKRYMEVEEYLPKPGYSEQPARQHKSRIQPPPATQPAGQYSQPQGQDVPSGDDIPFSHSPVR